MAVMTEKEFAEHVGAPRSAVQRRRKRGLLPSAHQNASGHWRYDESCVAEWHSTTTTVRVAGLGAAGEDGEVLGAQVAWNAARTRRENANAEKAELELARLRGDLISAAEVEAAWVAQIKIARNKLLALPTRLKQACPNLSTADMAKADGVIREALEELADGNNEADTKEAVS